MKEMRMVHPLFCRIAEQSTETSSRGFTPLHVNGDAILLEQI